jgi:hypothetical protein
MTETMPRSVARPRGAPRRHRGLRRLGTSAVVALLAVTVGSLATNRPLAVANSGAGVAVAPSPGPSNAVSSPAPSGPIEPSAAGGLGLGAPLGGLGAGGPSGSAALGAGGAAGSSASSPGVTGAGGVSGAGSSPSAAPGTVIVHPTLQLLAFGGQVGMPLLCTVAISAAGPALTDPGVSAVVAQIQQACVTGANQGADGLRALDQQLSALAAVNPAVRPVLDSLASSLDAAARVNAPFVTYLLQISALVRFFDG